MPLTQGLEAKSGRAPRKEKQPPRPAPSPVGKMVAARNAVRDFLAKDVQAREVRVTKLAPLEDGGWVAEADVLVPDLGVKRLGLKLSQEVLECEFCTLVLDSNLGVTSYELMDPDEK